MIADRIISMDRGAATDEELQGLVYAPHEHIPALRNRMPTRLRVLEGTWLQKPLAEAPVRPAFPFEVPPGGLSWFRRPGFLVFGYLALASALLFGVLW